MRVLSRLIWIPCLIGLLCVIALFVISNRETVHVSLWPFASQITVPIWSGFLGSFGLGLLIGAIIVWLAHLPKRARLHMTQRKLLKAQSEIATQKQKAMDTGQLEISE